MTNNAIRADRAREVLESIHNPNNSDQDTLTDLLTDLRHYCIESEENFAQAIRMSEIHFNEEQ